MHPLPLRLNPGQDLRQALENVLVEQGCAAAFVLSGIGSLSEARVRLAGGPEPQPVIGDMEILTLSGTIATQGAHLHITLAKSDGTVFGGHVAHGCIVRTTAEVLVALLPEWEFTRGTDPVTGYDELVVRRVADRKGG